MIHQPYYTIYFTAVNCIFEFLTNDIPIVSLEGANASKRSNKFWDF